MAKSVAGTKGVIDVYYRQDIKTDGKVALSGSTYGNGMAYADIKGSTEKLTVQAYALARSSYGKSYPLDVNRMTNRDFEENLHVNLDFKLSELFAEIGADYTNNSNNHVGFGDSFPYGFVEFNTPLFTPDLWLMIGTEMDYENVWHVDKNREQYLLTDFYAQLDYTHGPWVLTLGDRFRIMSFWKSPITANRYSGDAFLTQLVHQGVLRYSYQKKNFFLHSSVEGNWYCHTAGPRHMLLGFRNSIYWHTGPLELTLGANYYHQHVNSGVTTPSDNDNFVTLKAAPVLNLAHGFRLSSVLLYSNKQLGSKCNVFAEFHDLAGYVSGNWQQLGDLYQNRALSIGATLYPFRK